MRVWVVCVFLASFIYCSQMQNPKRKGLSANSKGGTFTYDLKHFLFVTNAPPPRSLCVWVSEEHRQSKEGIPSPNIQWMWRTRHLCITLSSILITFYPSFNMSSSHSDTPYVHTIQSRWRASTTSPPAATPMTSATTRAGRQRARVTWPSLSVWGSCVRLNTLEGQTRWERSDTCVGVWMSVWTWDSLGSLVSFNGMCF